MKTTYTNEQVRQWAARKALCRVLNVPVESIEAWGRKQQASERREAALNEFRVRLGVRG